MSCATKNIIRLIQDSFRSPRIKYNTDISLDNFTLNIYGEFTRMLQITKKGLFDVDGSVYFEGFDLPKSTYKYEIIRTHNGKDNLILSGKYEVTDNPSKCTCESSDIINFTENTGDEVFSFEYTEVILNVGDSPGGSVSWNEITDKPSFFSGNYSDLVGKPVLFSGSYNDLTNKPTIPAAQVNSDWNSSSGLSQILNKPNLFSGSYSDLTNKPTLFSGVYADLTGKPTIPNAQVNSDWNAVSGIAQILNKPVLFSGAYSDLTGKPILFDGAWSSLTGKPTTFTPSAHTHVYADITDRPLPSSFTGSAIALDKTMGNYQTASANSATTYTTTGAVLGGWAIILINAATQPTITGATLITGSTFTASTNMYMYVRYNGYVVEYYFAKI